MLRIGPADDGEALMVKLEPIGAVLGDFFAPRNLLQKVEGNALSASAVGQVRDFDAIRHSDSFRALVPSRTLAETRGDSK